MHRHLGSSSLFTAMSVVALAPLVAPACSDKPPPALTPPPAPTLIAASGGAGSPAPTAFTPRPSDPPAPTSYAGLGFFETTSLVIPAGAHSCGRTTNRLLTFNGTNASVGGNGSGTQLLVSDEIGTKIRDASNLLFPTAATPFTKLPSVPTDCLSTSFYPYLFGTDNSTARASNGDIVHARLGLSCPSFPNGDKCGHMFMWRSRDCGDTWTEFLPHDIASGADGFGNLDHVELYADPWSANLFLTSRNAATASACLNGTTATDKVSLPVGEQIWRLNVDGPTMTASRLKFFIGAGELKEDFSFPIDEPLMVTTTPSGRLFVFQCSAAIPTVYYTSRGFTSGNPADLVHLDSVRVSTQACSYWSRLGGAGTAANPLGTTGAPDGSTSISRVSSSTSVDTVRVIFPYLDGSPARNQKLRVFGVKIAEATNATTIATVTEAKGSPLQAPGDGSVWQAMLIETDRVDLPLDDPTNVALLYWQESDQSPVPCGAGTCPQSATSAAWGFNYPGPALAQAKMMALAIRDLDVSGTRAAISPTFSPTSRGEYQKGAFYADPASGKLHFVPIWPDPGTGRHLWASDIVVDR